MREKRALVLPLTLFVRAVEIHSAENFASRYNSWLLILIYKPLFFIAQVLARYLLPRGPPCWERAGELLFLHFYSWRQGNLRRGISTFSFSAGLSLASLSSRAQSLLAQWGSRCGEIICLQGCLTLVVEQLVSSEYKHYHEICELRKLLALC